METLNWVPMMPKRVKTLGDFFVSVAGSFAPPDAVADATARHRIMLIMTKHGKGYSVAVRKMYCCIATMYTNTVRRYVQQYI